MSDTGLRLQVTDSSGRVAFECQLETFTDVGDKFVFIDSEGDGRLMVDADELQEMAMEP